MRKFDGIELKKLYTSPANSSKIDNGQITIIGGSRLFHGAPLLALKSASRIVDMVYFASPEASLSDVALHLKSQLLSFIWIPWEDLYKYIEKSDAVLIGSGFMRASREGSANGKQDVRDLEYLQSRNITEKLLLEFPGKKWVIDAGSLQVMDPAWIPSGAILTPNKKEYEMLFGNMEPGEAIKKYKCSLVIKGPTTYVYSGDGNFEVHGGNAGLTKGGTGDVEAGLTVALLAKNPPLLAASAAAYLVKKTAERLAKNSGNYYNSDDLSEKIGETYNDLVT